ncbi:MAG: substrate-binding domain-containing protein [Christensenellaceae bacterium]|nr:substrate-binding domain-containing protein [Christensenellaceae bacterium]
MKKTLALVLALLMVVVALFACGDKAADAPVAPDAPDAPTTPDDGEDKVDVELPLDIAVEVKATESDFWQYMLIGARMYAAEFPDRVKMTEYGPQKELDVDEAVSILEQIVETQPDGIVLASNSSDATVPGIEKAYDAGIICIIADNGLNTDKYHAFLATDNLVGGALAADTLVEGMQAKGKTEGTVLVVSSSGGSQVMTARMTGFIEQMQKEHTEYTLYQGGFDGVQYCENDIAKAVTICENLFSANDDIVGVFGCNNMSGNGVCKYTQDAGIADEVTVVCYDSDPEEIKALEAGALYAMVVQDPAGFGYFGCDLIYKILVEGYDVEANYPDKYIDTGCTKITKENKPDYETLVDPYLLEEGATREWNLLK